MDKKLKKSQSSNCLYCLNSLSSLPLPLLTPMNLFLLRNTMQCQVPRDLCVLPCLFPNLHRSQIAFLIWAPMFRWLISARGYTWVCLILKFKSKSWNYFSHSSPSRLLFPCCGMWNSEWSNKRNYFLLHFSMQLLVCYNKVEPVYSTISSAGSLLHEELLNFVCLEVHLPEDLLQLPSC
jgi:hypothetical protein